MRYKGKHVPVFLAPETGLFTDFLTLYKLLTNILAIYDNCCTFASEKAERRERGRSLLLLYEMKDEAQILALEHKVEQLISDAPDLFLVEVRIKPTNNIKVFIDGDNGINIDRLVRYNRRLYKLLEEENFFPGGNFSLELSSPGLDEPLKLHRQYIKNINRFVELTDNEGHKTEGQLKKVTDDEVEIESVTGKKKEIMKKQIPIQRIKTIKVQIKF